MEHALSHGAAMLELRAGRFALADDYAERARAIRRDYTIDEADEPLNIALVAQIAAHRGDLERARSLTESNLPLTERHPDNSLDRRRRARTRRAVGWPPA